MADLRCGTVLAAGLFALGIALGAPGVAAADPGPAAGSSAGAARDQAPRREVASARRGPRIPIPATASPSALKTAARGGGPFRRSGLFNRAPTLAAHGPGNHLPTGQIWDYIRASDPEGDPIRYSLDQAPRYGTVSVSADGFYTYTPGAGFSGADTFTIGAEDARRRLAVFNRGRHTQVDVTVRSGPADGVVVDGFDGAAGARPYDGLWSYELGNGVGEGLQTYTDALDNVRLDGQGHLVIEARPASNGGYTSGFLDTKGKLDMMYGTMTARIKFPAGQGIWPAFWMLGSTFSRATWNAPDRTGWPGCGGIDVMEFASGAGTYHAALHGPQGALDYYKGSSTPWRVVGVSGPASGIVGPADLSADFHDYWVTREPDLIIIGIDEHVIGTFSPASLPPGAEWVFNEPMFALLNVAVGGPWPGPPDATTPWPATMLVDSFRFVPKGPVR